jgi:hypothetical protein
MKRFLLWTGIVTLVSVFTVLPVTAQSTATTPLTTVACNVSNFFGFPSWDSCLRKKYGGELKITDINDVWLIVLPILEAVIRATGYIAVGFIIWGGIKYTKSQGDSKQTAAARSTILNAIIGLVIVILSVAIVQFVSGRF